MDKDNWTVSEAIVVLDTLLSREGRQCKLAGVHGVCVCVRACIRALRPLERPLVVEWEEWENLCVCMCV